MTRHPRIALSVAAAAAVALSAFAGEAFAQERKSPLEGQPAVRHRLLLVKKRFEVAPSFEGSLNADNKHTVAGGLKAEYHLSDMWSFGGVGFFGASFDTGLTTRIIETLPETTSSGDPTPTKTQYSQHLNEMPVHGGAYLTLTPWYGKLAAFGKAFVNFDFYFSAGVSVAQLKSTCENNVCNDENPGGNQDVEPIIPPDNNPNNDPPLNDGLKVGVFLGGGIHVFLSNWVALDLSVRDYMFSDNPSGLDFDADRFVSDNDSRFLNHLFFGVGVSLFFPTKVERTP